MKYIIKNLDQKHIGKLLGLIYVIYCKYCSSFYPSILDINYNDINRDLSRWIVIYDFNNEKIISFCYVYKTINYYTCAYLTTKPIYRGNGFASKIIDRIKTTAIKENIYDFRVVIRSSLKENISFFKKHGFKYMGKYSREHDIYQLKLIKE